MKKILVADDEKEIISFIKTYLELESFEVITASNGVEVLQKIKELPDLVLLDIMMPFLDGYEACKVIKEKDIPVIFLTAKNALEDRLKCFDVGGDDYIEKPFYIEELIVRIYNVLNHKNKVNDTGMIKKYGNIVIHYNSYEVKVDNEIVPLTKTEFQIIELLSLHPNTVFSKEQIYEYTQGEGYSNVVLEHIRKIRKKFLEFQEKDIISTKWGIGYQWKK